MIIGETVPLKTIVAWTRQSECVHSRRLKETVSSVSRYWYCCLKPRVQVCWGFVRGNYDMLTSSLSSWWVLQRFWATFLFCKIINKFNYSLLPFEIIILPLERLQFEVLECFHFMRILLLFAQSSLCCHW